MKRGGMEGGMIESTIFVENVVGKLVDTGSNYGECYEGFNPMTKK